MGWMSAREGVSQDKRVMSKGLLAYIAAYVHKYGQWDTIDHLVQKDGPLDNIDLYARMHGPRDM